MHLVGEWQAIDMQPRPGSTVVKLALNVGNVFTKHVGMHGALPKDCYFDDDLFFEVCGLTIDCLAALQYFCRVLTEEV